MKDHEKAPAGDIREKHPGGVPGDCAPVHPASGDVPEREDPRSGATVSGCIFPNGKAEREGLESQIEKFQIEMSERIEEHVRRSMRAWLARHPRRSLRLIDAMGVCPLWVEGPRAGASFSRELLDYTERDVRLRRAVEPLFDLMRWFAEITDRVGIALGEIIEHGPKSGHSYFNVDGMLCNPDGTRSIFDDVDE